MKFAFILSLSIIFIKDPCHADTSSPLINLFKQQADEEYYGFRITDEDPSSDVDDLGARIQAGDIYSPNEGDTVRYWKEEDYIEPSFGAEDVEQENNGQNGLTFGAGVGYKEGESDDEDLTTWISSEDGRDVDDTYDAANEDEDEENEYFALRSEDDDTEERGIEPRFLSVRKNENPTVNIFRKAMNVFLNPIQKLLDRVFPLFGHIFKIGRSFIENFIFGNSLENAGSRFFNFLNRNILGGHLFKDKEQDDHDDGGDDDDDNNGDGDGDHDDDDNDDDDGNKLSFGSVKSRRKHLRKIPRRRFNFIKPRASETDHKKKSNKKTGLSKDLSLLDIIKFGLKSILTFIPGFEKLFELLNSLFKLS